MEPPKGRRWYACGRSLHSYVVELCGTAGLVAVVTFGAVVRPDLNPVFVACYVFLIVSALGSVADIHMNPVISWAVWFVSPEELSYMDSTYYITLQYVGGCLAACGFLRFSDFQPVYFQPIPPYTITEAFIAESIFSGLLCLAVLILRDFDFRTHKYRVKLHTAAKASSLDSMETESKTSSSSSVKIGKTRSHFMSRSNIFKAMIFGASVGTLAYSGRQFSGASLNPALYWAGAFAHQLRHGRSSVNMWLFVPYSLGPYMSSTIVAITYRLLRARSATDRQAEPDGERESLLHNGQAAIDLVK